MPTVLEFWPEYNSGPLWLDGHTVDLASLGLSTELIERLTTWNGRYEDSNLPFERNDQAWLNEGTGLLADVRAALDSDYTIIVTEPWWDAT